MTDRLLRHPFSPLLLIAVYLLLQWLLRVFNAGGFELDEAEQLVLGQRLQLGYSPDPPLYTWLQIPLFKLLGEGAAALSLLKNLLLFATYASTYFIGRHCGLSPQRAGLAALSLILLPQIGWESQRDLTHSVLVTTLAAVSLWAVLALLDGRRHWHQYLLIGVLLGLGMLSKWNYAFFALALVITLASLRPGLLFRPASLLSLLLFAALIVPFLLWAQENLAVVTDTSYKLKLEEIPYWQGLGRGVLSLANAYLQFSALFILAFVLVFRPWKLFRQADSDRQHPLALHFLLRLFWVTLGILLLFLLVSGGTAYRSRWLLPLMFYLPVLVFALAPEGLWQSGRVRHYQRLLPAMMLIVLLGLAARVYLLPLRGDYTKPHFPGQALARELIDAAGRHELLIAKNSYIGGNLKPWLGGTFVSSPPLDFPLSGLQRINNAPLLLVWDARESRDLPAKLRNYLSRHLGDRWSLIDEPHVIEANYRFSNDEKVRLAWQMASVEPSD